jgi:hypothetical protein
MLRDRTVTYFAHPAGRCLSGIQRFVALTKTFFLYCRDCHTPTLMVYIQLMDDNVFMEFSLRFASANFIAAGAGRLKSRKKGIRNLCLHKWWPKGNSYNFFTHTACSFLLCSDICICNSGFSLWARSQMEESVAPLFESGRRTTHQFALRLDCLFIYGLINEGAWRMGRWRLGS